MIPSFSRVASRHSARNRGSGIVQSGESCTVVLAWAKLAFFSVAQLLETVAEGSSEGV